MSMILTFEILGHARNHGKKFLKLCQTSFSGTVHSVPVADTSCTIGFLAKFNLPLKHQIKLVRKNLFHKGREGYLMFLGFIHSCWFHGPRIISAASNVVF